MVLLCPSGMGSEEKLPITARTRHKDYDGLVGSVFHNRKLVPREVVDYYEGKFGSRAWRKAAFQTVRGTKSHCVAHKLPRYKNPALVICGQEDQIVDPEHVLATAPGARQPE